MRTNATPAHLAFSKRRGFTLLEMLVALLIAGLLTLGALPHAKRIGHAAALASEVNRLQRAFSLARNTAITQRKVVTLCPITPSRRCSNDWSLPLAVIDNAFEGGATPQRVLRVFPAHPASQITYNRHWRRVRYTPLGHTSGYNGTFQLCASGGVGRVLVLSQLGRLRVDDTPSHCP